MLKFLVGFMLLANAGLAAYNAGYLGSGSAGREPDRAANQLEAQRIRLTDPARLPASTAPSAGVQPAPVETDPIAAFATVPAAAAVVAVATQTAAVTAAGAGGSADAGGQCIEIGTFDAADARRFEQQLASLNLGDRLTRRNVQEAERFIVYIPPLPDKETADRKGAELRRLGVTDFYLFGENSDLRLGISLGFFRTAQAANQHLANLSAQGVRSAVVAARGIAAGRSALQLRQLTTEELAGVTRIRADFPRQEARSCPPA